MLMRAGGRRALRQRRGSGRTRVGPDGARRRGAARRRALLRCRIRSRLLRSGVHAIPAAPPSGPAAWLALAGSRGRGRGGQWHGQLSSARHGRGRRGGRHGGPLAAARGRVVRRTTTDHRRGDHGERGHRRGRDGRDRSMGDDPRGRAVPVRAADVSAAIASPGAGRAAADTGAGACAGAGVDAAGDAGGVTAGGVSARAMAHAAGGARAGSRLDGGRDRKARGAPGADRVTTADAMAPQAVHVAHRCSRIPLPTRDALTARTGQKPEPGPAAVSGVRSRGRFPSQR
jgi:hypothetical protein